MGSRVCQRKKATGYAVIKAIETVYNGYRFRSRLEARWAVFFDKLGIKYEYEPEGFDLDGVRYLPDFWLPELQYWIEVKPLPPNEKELEKAHRLALASKRPVYFLLTIPQLEQPEEIEDGVYLKGVLTPTIWGFTPVLFPEGKDFCVLDDGGLLWTLCPTCHNKQIAIWGALTCRCPLVQAQKELDMFQDMLEDAIKIGTINLQDLEEKIGKEKMEETDAAFRNFIIQKHTDQSLNPSLLEAYTAARQARFEHGEKP